LWELFFLVDFLLAVMLGENLCCLPRAHLLADNHLQRLEFGMRLVLRRWRLGSL
jgi:hypothetical protein